MNVGFLVRHTILLQRVYLCDHEWGYLNDSEEQCVRCSVIATLQGKDHLARMARTSNGRTEAGRKDS